ncbi:hypothetical protein AMTRI_Chr05g71480 [Amborella trichopoda]
MKDQLLFGNCNMCGFPLNKPCEVSKVAILDENLVLILAGNSEVPLNKPQKVTPKQRQGPMVLILAGAIALVILAMFFCRKSREGCRKSKKWGESGGLRVMDEGPTALFGNCNPCGFPLNKPCEVLEVAILARNFVLILPENFRGPFK